jgi:hypothetical protein
VAVIAVASGALSACAASAATGGSDGAAQPAGRPAARANSCVAPVLGTTPHAGPAELGHPTSVGEVGRGDPVTVYGHWYFAGCSDTGVTRTALPAAPARRSVVLTLRTSAGASFALATVHPDTDGSFAATVHIPASARPGPAVITDGEGHLVRLAIPEP